MRRRRMVVHRRERLQAGGGIYGERWQHRQDALSFDARLNRNGIVPGRVLIAAAAAHDRRHVRAVVLLSAAHHVKLPCGERPRQRHRGEYDPNRDHSCAQGSHDTDAYSTWHATSYNSERRAIRRIEPLTAEGPAKSPRGTAENPALPGLSDRCRNPKTPVRGWHDHCS